jgi:hypothetical protein
MKAALRLLCRNEPLQQTTATSHRRGPSSLRDAFAAVETILLGPSRHAHPTSSSSSSARGACSSLDELDAVWSGRVAAASRHVLLPVNPGAGLSSSSASPSVFTDEIALWLLASLEQSRLFHLNERSPTSPLPSSRGKRQRRPHADSTSDHFFLNAEDEWLNRFFQFWAEHSRSTSTSIRADGSEVASCAALELLGALDAFLQFEEGVSYDQRRVQIHPQMHVFTPSTELNDTECFARLTQFVQDANHKTASVSGAGWSREARLRTWLQSGGGDVGLCSDWLLQHGVQELTVVEPSAASRATIEDTIERGFDAKRFPRAQRTLRFVSTMPVQWRPASSTSSTSFDPDRDVKVGQTALTLAAERRRRARMHRDGSGLSSSSSAASSGDSAAGRWASLPVAPSTMVLQSAPPSLFPYLSLVSAHPSAPDTRHSFLSQLCRPYEAPQSHFSAVRSFCDAVKQSQAEHVIAVLPRSFRPGGRFKEGDPAPVDTLLSSLQQQPPGNTTPAAGLGHHYETLFHHRSWSFPTQRAQTQLAEEMQRHDALRALIHHQAASPAAYQAVFQELYEGLLGRGWDAVVLRRVDSSRLSTHAPYQPFVKSGGAGGSSVGPSPPAQSLRRAPPPAAVQWEDTFEYDQYLPKKGDANPFHWSESVMSFAYLQDPPSSSSSSPSATSSSMDGDAPRGRTTVPADPSAVLLSNPLPAATTTKDDEGAAMRARMATSLFTPSAKASRRNKMRKMAMQSHTKQEWYLDKRFVESQSAKLEVLNKVMRFNFNAPE